MTDFKRDHGRYIVIKLKDLDEQQIDDLRGNLIGIRTRECVVIEPDWPIYEETWENVQRLAEGRPSIGDERDALAAHVEVLRAALEYSVNYLSDNNLNSIGHGSKAHREMQNALNQPATSLAHLKAGWQVAALETAVITAQMKGQTEVASWLQDLADTFRCRHQGENGGHGRAPGAEGPD